MREIKFRVWLPKARRSSWSGGNPPDRRKFGRMLEFDQIYFSISDDSLQHPQIFTDTSEHFYGEDIEKSQEDAVLLQYTGLRDKNGVEIYEGDIVTTYNKTVKEVKWLDETTNRNGVIGFNVDSRANYEVIGNIYENGDLLKEANS